MSNADADADTDTDTDTDTDAVIVRAANSDDTTLLRDIRLAALSDVPGAFLSRYEDFVSLDEDEWRVLVTSWTSPPGNAAFVAVDTAARKHDRGIGHAMASAFHAHGATMLLADINRTGLDQVVVELPGSTAFIYD